MVISLFKMVISWFKLVISWFKMVISWIKMVISCLRWLLPVFSWPLLLITAQRIHLRVESLSVFDCMNWSVSRMNRNLVYRILASQT